MLTTENQVKLGHILALVPDDGVPIRVSILRKEHSWVRASSGMRARKGFRKHRMMESSSSMEASSMPPAGLWGSTPESLP